MKKRSKKYRLYLTTAFMTSVVSLTLVLGTLLFLIGTADAAAPVATSKSATSGACTVDPKHKKLQDQDPEDKLYPWKRNGAKQVTISFTTNKATPEYKAYIEFAAKTWSKSQCVNVKAVSACPAKGYCVPISFKKSGGDGVEGDYSEKHSGGYMKSGRIEYYTSELKKDTVPERKSTVLHEMGHAIGLAHRKTDKVVMTGEGNDGIITPDDKDWQNLRVIYGKQK